MNEEKEVVKTVDDIVIENGVAVLYDALYAEDIHLVHQYAIDHNIEKYVAIKTANNENKRFAIVDGAHKLLNDGEYGINEKYVAPVEETTEDVAEKAEEKVVEETAPETTEVAEVAEGTVTEETPVEEAVVKDVVAETSEEDVDEKNSHIAELEAKLLDTEAEKGQLELKVSELEATVSQLTDELETLKATTPDDAVLVSHETELADVTEFLRSHNITSITIR